MRILFVNSTRSWGGVKTWTVDLAGWLAGHGHHVRVVARPGPFLARAGEAGAIAESCGFGCDFHPGLIRRFFRTMRADATDLVVVNVGKDLRTAGVAARLAGVPVVHRVGLPGDMKNAFKVRALHRFVRPALLAPCEFIKTGLLDTLPHLRPGEITVIPTGKVPAAQTPDTVHAPRRIVATSQLNPDKGHAGLLRSLARLSGKGLSNFHLTVAGTGSQADALKEQARALGLAGRVDFAGFVPDVRALLARSDVFVLASFSEGLPNALLEAMAEGLAPVARNVGGVGEVFPEALSHLLVRGTGEAELEAALGRVLEAPDHELLAARQTAWRTCREKFDLAVQAAATADFFARVARGGTEPLAGPGRVD